MRICPVCGAEIKGRRDKIYCSPNCKSAFQYENRMIQEDFYFKIDRQLKINRKILKRHNVNGYTKLRSKVLLDMGFNPKYFTHFWKNNQNQIYLFCYEFGYLKLTEKGVEKYLLVTWQNYMEK